MEITTKHFIDNVALKENGVYMIEWIEGNMYKNRSGRLVDFNKQELTLDASREMFSDIVNIDVAKIISIKGVAQ